MIRPVLITFLCLLAPLAAQDTDRFADIKQRAKPEEQRSLAFLCEHMPAVDAKSLPPELLLANVQLAHAARVEFAWGKTVPDELFRNYVLPYAQADEKREDWRKAMVERCRPLVKGCKTPGEAARALNEKLFDLVNVHYSTKRRSALQAPGESIEQGMATCTGLSILLADACRACCVPARVISVRWPHKRGNHSWVEIWDGETWRFCGADEPDPLGFDRAWFVGDAKKCKDADAMHRVYAVSFAKTDKKFAVGWSNSKLWGTDESARYADGSKGPKDAALLTQLARYFAASGDRQVTFEFDRNLDEELRTKKGDARLRKLVYQAWLTHLRKKGSEDAWTRPEMSRRVTWKLDSDDVRDSQWVHVGNPKIGASIHAELEDSRCKIHTTVACELWLDAQLVDLSKPFTVRTVSGETEVTPEPTLRTLCRTMQTRGGPARAATWVVPVPAAN